MPQLPPPLPENEGLFIPPADTTLAALAVVEHFNLGEYRTMEALLASMSEREIRTGLLDVAKLLTSMVANAGETTPQAVIKYLRKSHLGLINSGELSAG